MVNYKIKSLRQLYIVLVVLWTATFFIHEKWIPVYQAHKCGWSKLNEGVIYGTPDTSDVELENSDMPVTNVMLIADPQLIDNHTYPGRNHYLLKVSEHTADVYLKKNYKALVNHLRPDYIFFLGDYLDNGRSSTDEYFTSQYKRFKSIFSHKKFGYTKDKNFFTNVAGNHDIGVSDGVKPYSRDRFSKVFGEPNSIVNIGNVNIISLDTASLLAEKEEINGPTKKFLEDNFEDSATETKTNILLSHIPLYRDPGVQRCGPLRENPQFRLLKGYQFQSAVDNQLSTEILHKIKPALVFSGDDHDYCDVNHQGTREITVKSMSMAMGIWYPAVQLLSFTNHPSRFNYKTEICYLPVPYRNIIHYVMMAIFSGVLVILWVAMQKAHKEYIILPLNNSQVSVKAEETNNPQLMSRSVSNYITTINNFCRRYRSLDILKHFVLLGSLVLIIYNLFIASM